MPCCMMRVHNTAHLVLSVEQEDGEQGCEDDVLDERPELEVAGEATPLNVDDCAHCGKAKPLRWHVRLDEALEQAVVARLGCVG